MLGEDLIEGFDRAVGKADVGAMFVHAGALDEPRLRGPAGGDAGLGGEGGGDVVDLRPFVRRNALAGESGVEGGALPSLFRDAVGLEGLQPEGLPCRFFVQRGPLGPDVLVVVQVTVQAYRDRAHVGDATCFAGAQEPVAGIGEKKERENAKDNGRREDF